MSYPSAGGERTLQWGFPGSYRRGGTDILGSLKLERTSRVSQLRITNVVAVIQKESLQIKKAISALLNELLNKLLHFSII